jgi:hypothetical protein
MRAIMSNTQQQIPQTKADYKRIFGELQEALRLSSESYDRGFKGEAKRLALTIRVLLHDTSKSISLFTQLNVKNAGKYFATPSPYAAGNLLTESHLIKLVLPSKDLYAPLLADFPPVFPWGQLDFGNWWSEPILRDNKRRNLSRRDIVLALSNKDGGGHVDPNLEEIYADLSRRNSMAWGIHESGEKYDPEYGPEYACARQIAFELTKTIDENLSSAIAAAFS